MDPQRHTVIIGAGVIGCNTAYFLTRHAKFNAATHRITLLEACSAVAPGASGKAGGLLATWAEPDPLAKLSYRLHAELAAEHDGAARWGYRNLTSGDLEARISRSSRISSAMAAVAALPKDLDFIDPACVVSWTETVTGTTTPPPPPPPGSSTSSTAQIHPLHFTNAMADLARQAGVVIRTDAQVTRIVADGAGVGSVEYRDRKTNEMLAISDATDVVVTAGPWTSVLLPWAKITGLRAHSVVYRADVGPYAVFASIQLPPNYVPAHRAERKPVQKGKDPNVATPEIYSRPFGEVYACGDTDEPPLPETADKVICDEASCDDIVAHVGLISPILASAPVVAKQACILPVHIPSAKEADPLIGGTPTPNLWVASGHSCWGIQNSPATGKIMSELLLDGVATSANIDRFDPRKSKA